MGEIATIFACIVMYALGFMTCGAIIGKTPFWDGVRKAWSFGRRNDA